VAVERASINDWAQSLLREPEITDLFANGPRNWHLDTGSGLEHRTPPAIFSDEEFRAWIMDQVSASGRTYDARQPYIDFIFQGSFRAHAIFPPLAQQGIMLSLRRLPKPSDSSGASDRWSYTPDFWSILKEAVALRENILICGATGSGKTTLINDLLGTIPANERIVSLEDTPELAPNHPHWIGLVARAANADGFGLVSQRDLLKQTLRMRPDRIILGECRGDEVLDLLQASNTGHKGLLCTVHANSPRDGLRRIELLALIGSKGQLTSSIVRELIANAFQWIVYTHRRPGQKRRVIQSLARLEGREGETLLLRMVNRETGPIASLKPPGKR
jgi:pilus assembly protein CpaF